MAPTLAIFGSGMQGTCAAWDLARAGAAEVRLIDRDLALAHAAADRVRALVPGAVVTAHQADAARPESLASALGGVDALLSAVPYFLNPGVAKVCIQHGVHFNDLGGNTGVTRAILAMHEAALEAGVSLVPDCGVAPGLVATLVASVLQRFDAVQDIKMAVGGLPVSPRGAYNYAQVFALEGLANEYDGVAEVIRDGQRATMPTFADVVSVEFPGLGELEAFPTSGGTSTMTESFAGTLRSLQYRTLRYPGHAAHVIAWKQLGLLGEVPVAQRDGSEFIPREALFALLQPQIDFGRQVDDYLALIVEAWGTLGGQSVKGTWRMLDRRQSETGFSAMERCTAIPAAVVSWMQATGQVASGGRALEIAVPPAPFLTLLGERDLPLSWEIEQIG
jgi:lysine 6-dehydrogenase